MEESFGEFCRVVGDLMVSMHAHYSARGSQLFREEYHYRQVLRHCRLKVAELGSRIEAAPGDWSDVSGEEAFSRLACLIREFPWDQPIYQDYPVHDSALNTLQKVRDVLLDAVVRRTPPKLEDLKYRRIDF